MSALALSRRSGCARNELSEAFVFYTPRGPTLLRMSVYTRKISWKFASRGLPWRTANSLAIDVDACLQTRISRAGWKTRARLLLVEPRFTAAYGLGQPASLRSSNRIFFAGLLRISGRY